MNLEKRLEFAHTLVREFQEKFPESVTQMKCADHNAPENGFYSEWHVEGDVWAHTMMVYSHVVKNSVVPDNYPYYWKELLVSALLHDIGKCFTRKWYEDRQRIMFRNHSSVSVFHTLEVIPELVPYFTKDQIIFTLRLINYHQDFFSMKFKDWEKFKNSPGLFMALEDHRMADYAGNISLKLDNVDYYELKKIINKICSDREDDKKDSNPPKATFLIGLPNSGKSTYYLKNRNLLGKLHSRDALIHEVSGEVIYNKAFKIADQQFVDELFRTRFQASIRAKEDITIDRTNLRYKGRMKFVNQLRQAGYDISYKVFLPTIDVLNDRNENREGKYIPVEVYENMMGSFTMPYDNEYNSIEYIFRKCLYV